MKTIAIDDFIRWAMNDEWPKAAAQRFRAPPGPKPPGSAWGKVADWRVGGVNCFGVVEDLGAAKDVHPDAVALFDALAVLDEAEVDLPEGWSPMADVAATARDGASEQDVANALAGVRARALDIATHVDREGRRKVKGRAREIVLRRAGLRDRPGEETWRCEAVEVRALRRNGQPAWFMRQRVVINGMVEEVEVDGRDHKRHRPYAGAYRKWVVAPDPALAVVARAEYEVWWWSLALLVDELAGRCAAHDVVMSGAPMRPWEEGARPARKIIEEGTVSV